MRQIFLVNSNSSSIRKSQVLDPTVPTQYQEKLESGTPGDAKTFRCIFSAELSEIRQCFKKMLSEPEVKFEISNNKSGVQHGRHATLTKVPIYCSEFIRASVPKVVRIPSGWCNFRWGAAYSVGLVCIPSGWCAFRRGGAFSVGSLRQYRLIRLYVSRPS